MANRGVRTHTRQARAIVLLLILVPVPLLAHGDDPGVAAAVDAVRAVQRAIGALPVTSFESANRQRAFANKLNAALNTIAVGDYAGALEHIKHDVLGKTDGCSAGAAPDANDWIITCPEQSAVFPLLGHAVALLAALASPTSVAAIELTDSAAPPDDLAIDFGRVGVGSAETATVTIKSSGTGALVVGALTTTAPFGINVDPCSGQRLAPGEGCTITLEYRPTTADPVTGTLQIPSNASTTAPALVALSGSRKTVAIIVDPALVGGIHDGLRTFEDDLRKEQFAIAERIERFSTPEALRSYLQGVAAQAALVGAILVGDQPHAYQWVALNSTREEAISFQYYADLDGLFAKSQGYISPGGHASSFDLHTGNVEWEIWIGVLPAYRGDTQQTIDALVRYFEKNHAYRAGSVSIPPAFLLINEHFTASTQAEHDVFMSALRAGQYAWTPFSDAPGALIYFNSEAAALTAAQGYEALSLGVADFTVGEAHGWYLAHGQISYSWVEQNPVKTVFFWSDGCAVGNLDMVPYNFLSSILYSPTSAVLFAKGTTNNSGGMGTNEEGYFGHNVATAVSQGATMGDAVLRHVNVPLIYPWSESREFHMATPVLLGDPTLRPRPGP